MLFTSLFVLYWEYYMKQSPPKKAEEKLELPTKEELAQLTEEQFQQLLKDVKKRKYTSISSMMQKKES